jgi:hypothetical protein
MNVGVVIVSLFFLFLGILICVIYFLHSVRSKRWSVVIGNITDSRIELGEDSETHSTIYMIAISISYPFGSHIYDQKHKKIVYQSSVFDQTAAKLASDYPKGKEIKVWCNPAKPKKYMIQEDFGWGGNIFIGLILIGVGILIFCIGR